MEIRKVTISEIGRVMEIISDAIRLLGKDSLQWQQGYPNKEVMSEDINNGDLFGCYDGTMLIGVVALVKGLNENYTEIYEGAWITPSQDSDLVVHRIAVKEEYHHKKVGKILMDYAEEYAKANNCKSIKIDTHKKNIPMQKLCENNGYRYCGIIYLKRDELDNSRLAYEKPIG